MHLTAGPLTVRHLEPSGHESITQAISVSYQPGNNTPERGDEKPLLIAFGVPDSMGEGHCNYGSGTVYVMNEAGATVAKYDLGGWSAPA